MRGPALQVPLGSRPRWLGPVVLLAVVSLVAAAPLGGAAARSAVDLLRPPPIRLAAPVPGTRTENPDGVHVIAVLDESGSTNTSDPWDARHDEVVALAEMFSRSPDNHVDMVSIVHFAQEVSVRGPFRPSNELAAVAAAIRPPGGLGGGTRIASGLAAAGALCRSTEQPDVVLVITDGQDDLAEVGAAVSSTPCESVNLLLLNADRVAGALQPAYRSMDLDGLWRADTVGRATFATALVRAATRLTGQQEPAGGWVVRGG